MPYTNIPNMGLWATYMSKIGINPNLYAPLRHALIECSFFNIAFDGKDIDYKELINQEQQAIASNIDCLMIPCIRENNIASLLNKGYIPIPSFFNSIVKLSCEWQVHLKNSLSSRSCRDTMNEIREIEQNYVTEWIPLKDIVRNKSILTKIVGLYIQHAQKFDYPAIMYTQEILEHLENSIYSQGSSEVVTAKNANELYKVVNQALADGIRINACREGEWSFGEYVILGTHFHKFEKGDLKKIMHELMLKGAEFHDRLLKNKLIGETYNELEKEVQPKIDKQLEELKKAGENAVREGAVIDVRIDNETFFMELSKDSRIEVAKLIEGTRNLGLNKGLVKLGSNIIKAGNSHIEVKNGKEGTRNYVDMSDNSSFEITFYTSIGNLRIKMYHDKEDQVQVKAIDQEMWSELQKRNEPIGKGCLFGGMAVEEVLRIGSFTRCGVWNKEQVTEEIKESSKNETLSWVDRTRVDMTTNDPNSISYKVREEIRNCRLKLGYTQKDLARKIGVKYWLILQYEKGNRKIPIKKLYALAEALSVSIIDFIPEQRASKRCFENEGKEILNLARKYKEVKDQELSEILYLLTKFIRVSEEKSGKAVKIEIAKGLIKVGVSVDVISRATNLSIGEYEEKKNPIDSITYKIGQRVKEWRLRREYTQVDLASK
ncbi:Cro/C1-type helix-turn-helix domain,Lambda repressor-like, DNA-binding domain, partial [Cinara cedri]